MNAPASIPSSGADALCLDEIEERLGLAAAFADLGREHSKLNDLAGLEYSLRCALGNFRLATAAFKDIAARRAGRDNTAEAA